MQSVEKQLEYCQSTAELKIKAENAFLEIGARLSAIRDNEMFAGRWENFEDYCEDALKMTPGTASKLINIYTVLAVEYKVSPGKLAEAGGWTRLALILPLVENKKSAEEWVEKATTARSRADLEVMVKEKSKGVDQSACAHKNTYKIEICRDCGYRYEVYD